MAVNKKGIELKEYPKLVKLADGTKVRVLSEAEEAALENVAPADEKTDKKATKKKW